MLSHNDRGVVELIVEKDECYPKRWRAKFNVKKKVKPKAQGKEVKYQYNVGCCNKIWTKIKHVVSQSVTTWYGKKWLS